MSIDLSLASSSWDDNESLAIDRIVKSGMHSMGNEVTQFEREFSATVGSNYAVMVNSGSSANLLAVAALFYREIGPLKRGDEVIVPAVSWSTTYFPLHQYGLKIKFVDIDILTLNYDITALEAAITEDTKALVLVNLLGNPNDYGKIKKLVADRDIVVIEDNCESMGAEADGINAGTYGLLGTFSTYFSHHISTIEGGIVVTNDEELYHIMLSIRSHGWTRNLPDKNRICTKGTDDFYESFRFVLPGYNIRPIEIEAAIGREQLKKLPRLLEVRRENHVIFREQFSESVNFHIQKETGKSSWFGFSLIIKPESTLSRREILLLLKRNKIDVRPIVSGNFTRNEVIKFFDSEIFGELKNADHLHENGFFVGNHHYDISEKIIQLRELID